VKLTAQRISDVFLNALNVWLLTSVFLKNKKSCFKSFIYFNLNKAAESDSKSATLAENFRDTAPKIQGFWKKSIAFN